MKRFSIFRTGKHTAMSGTSLDFTADQLRAAVSAYNPALHEAPLVVGHPTTDAPAYGWVKELVYNEETGELDVVPSQVEEQFQELVEKGRFKKRSASFYLPGSDSHPLKGKTGHDKLYLKHVGFLGAVAPAVKGLRDVAFSEDGAETIEYADRWTFSSIASAFRGLRDWIISEKDLETADRVLPNYVIADLDRAANTPDPITTPGFPAYSEESTMTPAEIAAMQAQNTALQAENVTLKANQKPANFGELETSLATREAAVAAGEKAIARSNIESRVEKMIKAGKVLPKQKANKVDFAMGLTEGDATISFGEGDTAKKVTQREAYLLDLEAGPKLVDYNEYSAETGTDNRADLADIQRSISEQVATGGKKA